MSDVSPPAGRSGLTGLSAKIEHIFEHFLWYFRLVIVLGVVGLLMASSIVFILGILETSHLAGNFFATLWMNHLHLAEDTGRGLLTYSELIVAVIKTVDDFLVGIVLLIFEARARAYPGNMTVRQMDVHAMDFADASFDQVFTSCTFCSVPNPVAGLAALARVLKPGGLLGMFEHTGSRFYPFRAMLNVMNPVCRQLGPEINRDTVANVRAAGFEVEHVTNLYLDVVKTIEARAPIAQTHSPRV